MMCLRVLAVLLVALSTGVCVATEPVVRDISGAAQVFAVLTDFDLHPPYRSLIFAAWPDGHIVWSKDAVKGGPPYLSVDVPPAAYSEFVNQLAEDGLFHEKANLADGSMPHLHMPVTTLMVRSAQGMVKIRSSQWIYMANGSKDLNGDSRFRHMQKLNRSHMFAHFVWADLMNRARLITSEQRPRMIKGKLDKSGDKLSWREFVVAH